MLSQTKNNLTEKTNSPIPGLLTKLSEGETQFTNLDFRGIDLSGLNLAGVDFSHSNFEGTNFNSTKLKGTNFAGSNLRGASLRNANLRGAILIDADLTDADLAKAKLNQADLNRAIFKRVKCYKTLLSGAILPDGSIWSKPYYIGGIFSTEADIKALEKNYSSQFNKAFNFLFFLGILLTIHFVSQFFNVK
jgi:uncharacterized protein YjbI with pentapeptide repeats